MADVVLILGAGASKNAGTPLLADFLDRAEDLLLTKQVGHHDEDFRQVFHAIAELKHVQAQVMLDTYNLESDSVH